MVTMDSLLRLMFEKKASDLHLTVNMPPLLRIDGELVATDLETLKPGVCQSLISSVLADEQKERLERNDDLTIAFGFEKVGRVRMTAFKQRGTLAANLRSIPSQVQNFEELGLPQIVSDIIQVPKGLVLVCGPTGSGKTSTLAAMIDWINEHKAVHVLSLEDPIEYIHEHKKSLINQREVGVDVKSYAQGLQQALRQDPDVLLIGDIQDEQTIEATLIAAETGHLILASLDTTDSVQTIANLIEIFPPHRQDKIRLQLSFVLQAVLTQQLLPKGYSSGRVLACEVLIPTSAVRNLIREEKEHQIYAMMMSGGEYGMQTMNQALFELYQKQLVTYNEIFSRTTDPKDLQNLVKGTG